MSNLALSVVPDPHDQIASLQRLLQQKNERIAELEEQLRLEKTRNYTIEISARNLQNILTPLYNAVGGILGHIEAMEISSGSGTATSPAKREVWTSWKQKLGGKTADAIDVLLMHGPMTHTQLRIQLKCATRTCTNVVGALNRAGLIDRANGKISLKEL